VVGGMGKDFEGARVVDTARIRDEARGFRQTCVLRMQITSRTS